VGVPFGASILSPMTLDTPPLSKLLDPPLSQPTQHWLEHRHVWPVYGLQLHKVVLDLIANFKYHQQSHLKAYATNDQ